MKTAEEKIVAFEIPLPELREPKLPAKQESFLAAILSHSTIKAACGETGISETTGWRYLNDEQFRERYRKAQRQLVEHVIVRMRTDASEAAKTLRDVAEDETASSSARVAAAKAILEMVFKSVELSDIEGRMDALESNLKRFAEREAEREAKESNSET